MISELNAVIDIQTVPNGQLQENVQKIHIGWLKIVEEVVIDVVQLEHKFVGVKFNKQQLKHHVQQNVIPPVVSTKIFAVNFGAFKDNVLEMQHGWLVTAKFLVGSVFLKIMRMVIVKIITRTVLLGLEMVNVKRIHGCLKIVKKVVNHVSEIQNFEECAVFLLVVVLHEDSDVNRK
jgi:hypothetical protein